MVDFSKSSKGFTISKGYFEGKVLSEERIKELSEMPSREELIAKLVGTINAPVSNFVNLLATLIKNLMFALDAIKEKKEKESK
jgi:large subunit ribosomal protein L10